MIIRPCYPLKALRGNCASAVLHRRAKLLTLLTVEQLTRAFFCRNMVLSEVPLPPVSERVVRLPAIEPGGTPMHNFQDVGWNTQRYLLLISPKQVPTPLPKAQTAKPVHNPLPVLGEAVSSILWKAPEDVGLPAVPRSHTTPDLVNAAEETLAREECPYMVRCGSSVIVCYDGRLELFRHDWVLTNQDECHIHRVWAGVHSLHLLFFGDPPPNSSFISNQTRVSLLGSLCSPNSFIVYGVV